MFDIGVGYSEMLVLAILAVIFIGPKDLPKVLRTFGQFMTKMRGMAREFQVHVDAAMKDSGVDGLKKDLMDVRQSINSGASAPPGSVANPSAPKFPSMTSLTRKDFDVFFGETTPPGETRVAGTLHVDAA